MKFLSEFKRRKVLNTASLYVVGVWILLQVLEVLENFFPAEAMRWALVAAAALYPLVILAGWFFDISTRGIVRTGPAAASETRPDPGFIDYVQLAGHALVIGFVAYALSTPHLESTAPVAGTSGSQRTVAVLAFEDLQPAGVDEHIGEAFADELRDSLTRTAGLRVLGAVSSLALSKLDGNSRMSMAKELSVTAILLGEVLLDGGHIQVSARLVGPAGDEIWSNEVEGPVGYGVALQQSLVRQVIGAIAPNLDPDPVQGQRAEAGECSAVYESYLRGKQLSKARRYSQAELWNRGIELLHEAVSIDDQCAVAWEAIAVALEAYQTTSGFVEAGVAARRALELNDRLPEAWAVLAELAEDEGRWDDAEEYILRALRADPTNIRANLTYSINLLTRGRVREALQHALEAYRRDPASGPANNVVAIIAQYAGDTDLMIKHSEIAIELSGLRNAYMLESVAEAFLMRGETDHALELYAEDPQYPAWFPDCVRMRDDSSLAPAVTAAAHDTLEQVLAGETKAGWSVVWRLIRCGTWLEEPDIFYGLLLAKDIETQFGRGFPNEVIFTNLWIPDASIMRQDPRFRKLVVDSGLQEYWKKWGWADLCRPDGDRFVCD